MVLWHDLMKVSLQNNSLGDCPYVGHRMISDFWLLTVHCWHLGLNFTCRFERWLIHLCWLWCSHWSIASEDDGGVSSLLAPHSVHRLHVTYQEVLHQWLLLSHLGLLQWQPFWSMSFLIPIHVVTLCFPRSLLNWKKDRHYLCKWDTLHALPDP